MLRIVAVVLLAGCGVGGPAASVVGQPCDAGPTCASSTKAVTCEGGVWREFECGGPVGCRDSYATERRENDGGMSTYDAGFVCDWRRFSDGGIAKPGDRCPSSLWGAQWCDMTNPRQRFTCDPTREIVLSPLSCGQTATCSQDVGSPIGCIND